jgi:hypothetical protein
MANLIHCNGGNITKISCLIWVFPSFFNFSKKNLSEHFGTSSFVSTFLFHISHHLAILARKYLGIPASQASCERIFSITKNDITETRTCIKPDLAQSLLMLRKRKDII